ncbi:MAG: RNA polymerase sigma factor, partial [Eubacteriales bacterium]
MNPSKLATLLSRVKGGDGAAFEELYRCYFHRVFAVALSILKNEEDGKDAAQTVMTKLLLLPMDAFPASGENTWLYVITKNEALGILRKKNRESSASPEFWADIPDPRSELDQLLDLE